MSSASAAIIIVILILLFFTHPSQWKYALLAIPAGMIINHCLSKDITGGAGKHGLKSKSVIYFADYPEFKPNLTPADIFEMGSFGGTYWRPIHSSITGKDYKNKHLKHSYLKNIDTNKMTRDFANYDININKYKVHVGQTLEEWEKKGWITKYDPYGWVQWYCNFYDGRRTPDDERQIKRWIGIAGEKGRFRGWLLSKIKKKYLGGSGKGYDDYSISPAIRQTLQHWAYILQ